MKAIGGYFELELNRSNHYHKNAVKINTGRNALEYILRVNKYSKIYIPYYTCDTILEPIKKLNIEFEYYHIDENFDPLIKKKSTDSVILYTNFFGICGSQIKTIIQNFKNIIIDNCQSFYSKSLDQIDTFYSCRKFFGVPDGAYVYCNKIYDGIILQDISYDRSEHLIRRLDADADNGLSHFIKAEKALSNQPIKSMSKLTESLLSNVDYKKVSENRRTNYIYLNNKIKDLNKLDINIDKDEIPMVYPLLVENGKKLKSILSKNKIYVTTYWDNVFNWVEKNTWEYNLADNLVSLPIDQRYEIDDMKRIVKVIKNV
jgi:hypothetical protein